MSPNQWSRESFPPSIKLNINVENLFITLVNYRLKMAILTNRISKHLAVVGVTYPLVTINNPFNFNDSRPFGCVYIVLFLATLKEWEPQLPSFIYKLVNIPDLYN